jgi:glycosyltransferase involved in cell wall biosynthesis
VETSLLISVVIPNYNYEAYVAEAIESALALDWPSVEVIVVDDGSTDASREVIARFGDRITAIYQANAGQKAACNAGFARSRGEVVIFLDSDDLLDRSLPRELSRVFGPGVSKVQFQMKLIDKDGRPTGSFLPQYQRVPEPSEITRWVLGSASYPTPPGSGNAYARWFLALIFPLPGPDRIADSMPLAVAPLFGDVVTIAKPLVSYRMHGRNDGAMTELDPARFARQFAAARERFEYTQRIARTRGLELPDHAFDRSLTVLPYRTASFLLRPDLHPVQDDSSAKILRDGVRGAFVAQGLPARASAVILAWVVAVTVTPRTLGARLVLWRFSSQSRPKALRTALELLRVVKSADAAA